LLDGSTFGRERRKRRLLSVSLYERGEKRKKSLLILKTRPRKRRNRIPEVGINLISIRKKGNDNITITIQRKNGRETVPLRHYMLLISKKAEKEKKERYSYNRERRLDLPASG